ncbi:ATP-binding protein [Actinomadura darangshiensis]|uniref:ATP-binding protein n=1 Tax=Actinomadura darangshiensis TaxID=705336 RepID=A0A4R5BVH9_9ACTN|nr:ATP-binding protein [Actinomadura darangshiensis]
MGRRAELALLAKRLERVAASGAGTAVALRGRRQVGKSRLVQEFCDRAAVPYVFSTATKGASPIEAVAAFLRDLKESPLPGDPELVPQIANGNWPDAFRILATALPDAPSIVVLDELPWLAEQDPVFDGALQTGWDRLLSSKPVLLLLLGSDLHMMERLTAYDRPFYGRADNLVLGPLNPADTGEALGLDAADAIDAHLVSGGLPGIIRTWPHATPALDFMRAECADPAAALFSVPEASLLAEFPNPDISRRVLEAIGSGDRTHANIAATAGNRDAALPSGTLSPLLRRLTGEKNVLAMDEPLSTRPGKPALYRIADSNLRLYLAVLRAAHQQARRGRPEAGYRLVERRWTTWRGRAVEPLIRQSLERPELPWPDVETVGGWWNRQFNPEIDLVGADRAPVANRICFVGSIKWLNGPFDAHDLVDLRRAAAQLPGLDPATTGMAAVSLSGAETKGLDLLWTPQDVVAAWRP